MAKIAVDVRGDTCPHPLLKAKEEAEKLASGDQLVIITDNPPTLETIPRWAEKERHEVKVRPLGPTEWEITVTLS